MSKENILITGGAGFIGSHLCERMVKKYNVICLDNFSTGNQRNINHLAQLPDFEFIKQDLSKSFNLETMKELDRFQIDVKGFKTIFNLACPTSSKRFDEFKIQILDSNSLAMKNVLELVLKYKSNFVHLSSSVVYGGRDKKIGKLIEEEEGLVNHLSNRGCYDEGKRFAETMVATYHQVHKTDYKVARVFRCYGPRERLFDGEMLPDFIINATQNKDLVIYGDNKFNTSLVYVTDVVDALEKLSEAKSNIGAVNIGSDVDLNMTDVAKKVIDMTKSSSKVKYEPRMDFTTELALPDISKARDLLGWLPLVRLEDGLQKTIDYTVAHKELLEL